MLKLRRELACHCTYRPYENDAFQFPVEFFSLNYNYTKHSVLVVVNNPEMYEARAIAAADWIDSKSRLLVLPRALLCILHSLTLDTGTLDLYSLSIPDEDGCG